MRTSQSYLSCRENAAEYLLDKIEAAKAQIEGIIDALKSEIENRLDRDFIKPGRSALDSAISDGEDHERDAELAQEEAHELGRRITELEQEIDELKEQIEELKNERL